MPSQDPVVRSTTARIAALSLHANCDDPSGHTAPARAALAARFEREVDPDGVLSVAERQRRAAIAKRLFYVRMAYASHKARKAKKAGT